MSSENLISSSSSSSNDPNIEPIVQLYEGEGQGQGQGANVTDTNQLENRNNRESENKNGSVVGNQLNNHSSDEMLTNQNQSQQLGHNSNVNVRQRVSGLRQPPVEDIQTQPVVTEPPTPTPRRPRPPIVNDHSLITRNQLAFLLAITFGIFAIIALTHLYKQIQTAYIVSSLLHNVPVSKTPFRKSSLLSSSSSSSQSKSSPSSSPPPNIDSDLSNPSSTNPSSTNTIIHSKLSPEVELYAQQLQRVLGSLKRAIGNMDKSTNSSRIGGIIEMKPMSEVLKSQEEKLISKIDDNSKFDDSTKSNQHENMNEHVKDDLLSSSNNNMDEEDETDTTKLNNNNNNNNKKTDSLMNAYTLASDYITNLHNIVDEEMRRSNALENGEEDLNADKKFDLEKKKEENVQLFKKFVELVSNAQILDNDDEEEEGNKIISELKSKFVSESDDFKIISSKESEINVDVDDDDDDNDNDNDEDDNINDNVVDDTKTDKLFSMLADILGAERENDWNEDLNEYESNNNDDYDFEMKMNKARKVLGDIYKEEHGNEIKGQQKVVDYKDSDDTIENDKNKIIDSQDQDTTSENDEKERKAKEDNSPLFS